MIREVQPQNGSQSMLCFELAGRVFGIDTDDVVIVLGRQNCTRLPHCPSHVLGAFGYRGRAVGLIDLAAFLQIGSVKKETSTIEGEIDERTVVVRSADMTAGFAVSRVRGIAKRPTEKPNPLRFCDRGRLLEFAEMEIAEGNEIIIVLKATRVLNEARV